VSRLLATDERVTLENERDFLLRSLDDLDAERAAGNIDDETYEQLHADYTARAAAVLRRLHEGGDGRDGRDVPVATPEPPPARRSFTRRVLPVAAIAGFAIVATVLVAQSARQREPGGSLTGNAVATPDTTAPMAQVLADAVQRDPDSYNARIAYARYLLNNDLQLALEQYDAAARLAPRQPEPLAYAGWIRSLVARQLGAGPDRDAVVQSATERFDRAIEIAPTYPDSFVFRGLLRYTVLGDADAAVPDFQRFLQLAPLDHPQRDLVLDALARASDEAAAPGTTHSSPTPQP
jgi:tetratricopeptide (TPR) repeat protein